MSEPLFSTPWVILCEGDSDLFFFQRLIRERMPNVASSFTIRFPSREGNPTGGRGKMGDWLKNHWEMSTTFKANVKGVLIVADNDDDPARSFREVRAVLAASGGFAVPDAEQVVVTAPPRPAIVVVMLPIGGGHGGLETLCLTAAYRASPDTETALNNYCAAMPANGWRPGKQAKMRMQAMLAATCADAPDASAASHWRNSHNCNLDLTVPLRDPVFDGIADFVAEFETRMAVAGVAK